MDYYGPDEDSIDILRKKLDLLDGFYDYIFIDFPPAHNLVTMMYLVACDYIIVPMHLAKGSSINGYFDVIDKCKRGEKRVMRTKTCVCSDCFILMYRCIKRSVKYLE